MSTTQFRIAIIGGGPAGLTLGLLLHKRGIPFTIFELGLVPTDEDLARPSGSFDLHEGSGLTVIKQCGLHDEFVKLLDDCTEAQKIANREGQIIYEDEGESSDRPEISRHKLIKLLLSHLPPQAIKWGHKLISAKRSVSLGHVEVELDFGTKDKQIYNLVIGADGAWSKVRNLLTDVKPQYTGIQNVTVNIRQITTRYPPLAKLVGSGSFIALSNRNGIISQRSSQNSARMYILITTEDEKYKYTNNFDGKTASQAKSHLIDSNSPFSQWGATIRELIATACDDETANGQNEPVNIKPLYRLPVGHSWQHQEGATVIGDAAHLMCPWAGEGVNLAMRDSLLLSQAIIKAYDTSTTDTASFRSTLDQSIQEFEEIMIAEAKEPAEGTLENGNMMFGGEDGSAAMVEFFRSMGLPPKEPLENIRLDA